MSKQISLSHWGVFVREKTGERILTYSGFNERGEIALSEPLTIINYQFRPLSYADDIDYPYFQYITKVEVKP